MGARGAAILAMCAFIALLAFGSWLLNVPLDVIIIATVFAIGVIIWVGSRPRRPADARSSTPEHPPEPR